LALDVVVAGLVAFFSLGGAVYGPAGPLLPSRAGDVAIAAVGSAALLLRRRFPLPVAVISGAASIAVVTAPLLQVAGLYTLASFARSRRDHIVAGGVIVLVAATYSIALRLWANSSAAWATAFFVLLPGAVGLYVASRRALSESLQEKATRLEREQELLAQRVRMEERARIAREMHDVVAHHMSLAVLHAGALEASSHGGEALVAERARLIRSLGHQALEELREVVRMLRMEPDREPELPPMTPLNELDRLLDQSRRAGVAVTLHIDGDRGELNPQAERALFRLVQEGLTNVRKHAGGAAADIHLRYDERYVEAAVANAATRAPIPSAPPGSGTGLLGLRERVELLGGTLEAGRTPDGGYRLAARIPRRPDPPP
jgi:signal transduction histidine kinase